jgi:hypothetical protein
MLRHQPVHAKVFEAYDDGGYTGVGYGVALAAEEGMEQGVAHEGRPRQGIRT